MTMRLPVALLLTAGAIFAQQPNGAAINPPWTSADVIHVDDLSKIVQSKSASPLLLQVGFAIQYKSKHIPGAIFAGPGREETGLAELKKAVADVPKDRQIVLYCGCCPWDHCPNMKPAFTLLHSLGYTKVRVVEIPSSFLKDWAEKGLPVEGATAGETPLK
jgi:thiosulfate/3-mercaptopyruvate sulfurtransferase